MTPNLDYLSSLTCSGIYCLVDHSNQKIDIRYASNLLLSIAGLLKERHPKGLNLEIIEKDLNHEQMGIRHAYWISHYKQLGYFLYRKKPATSWKLVITIEKVDSFNTSKLFFIAKLVSQKKSLVIGIFDSNTELEEFLGRYYLDNKVNSVVYCNNRYTSLYHSYQRLLED